MNCFPKRFAVCRVIQIGGMLSMKRKEGSSASELIKRVNEIILSGRGIKKRVAADARRLRKFSRNDGVFFDPNWQDDIAPKQ
jgi:hypothetical protein